MTELSASLIAGIAAAFSYPLTPHQRRHGPRGYLDYASYKPWLRDEFAFRCVYCLTRERWQPDGHESFGADHFNPQSVQPALRNDYDNLFYVCCSCNAVRSFLPLPLDPVREALGDHLQITPDGVVTPRTPLGAPFISVCQLNRPRLAEFRRRLLALLKTLSEFEAPAAQAALQDLLAYPPDLPDLRAKRPPEGNERPEGISQSHFEQWLRGALPATY